MAKMIPVLPMPPVMVKAVAAPFKRFTGSIEKMFPHLEDQLKQAELGYDQKEYLAIVLFAVVFYTVFAGGLLTIALSKITPNYLPLGIGIGLFMGLMAFMQVAMFPPMQARKRVKEVERNLVFALRAILVQLKSGVSLFDSMTMVAKGNYGGISGEFKKAVDLINTGTPENEALEEMSEMNPSPYLRKSLWQIVNGMNAGADISDVLGETVRSMIREQKIAINRYGSQLRVLSLMYMMIGVIMPALLVTLLVIVFTFPMIGEAIEGMPLLKDTTSILKNVLPGESYLEGKSITGLEGRKLYGSQSLSIKIDQIEGKEAVFTLLDEKGGVIKTETVYGGGSNLRDSFSTADGTKFFGDSLEIKSIGPNIFGQEEVQVTRLEPTQLVFWGVLAMVSIMEFMYIGIIKSRRPSIIG